MMGQQQGGDNIRGQEQLIRTFVETISYGRLDEEGQAAHQGRQGLADRQVNRLAEQIGDELARAGGQQTAAEVDSDCVGIGGLSPEGAWATHGRR